MKEYILKQRFELFSVRSVFEDLGISLKDVTLRDRPDFSFVFEGRNIGLEETKCSFNEKAFKTESRLSDIKILLLHLRFVFQFEILLTEIPVFYDSVSYSML